ncbi:hypothetical protein [Sphingobium phenoxybenzoativorans]|nr:hypothetical protein [Sphingobium phenoxybenzoativorans]
MTTITATKTNPVLEFMRLIDSGQFTESLKLFSPDAMIATPLFNDGVPMNFEEFREFVHEYERNASPEERAGNHEVDRVFEIEGASIIEGFIKAPGISRYYMTSARYNSEGLITKYGFLIWAVEDPETIKILRG